MREFEEEIAKAQGKVVVVSFAKPEHLKRSRVHLGHPFLWLADPRRVSYARLGLGRKGALAIAPPRAVWGYVRLILRGRTWRPEQLDIAQMGGDFVFDRTGELTLRYLGSRSDDRPSMDTIMSAFRRAARNAGAAEA